MKKRLLCAVCVCLLSVGSGMAQTQRSMTVDQLFSLIESGSNVLTAHQRRYRFGFLSDSAGQCYGQFRQGGAAHTGTHTP